MRAWGSFSGFPAKSPKRKNRNLPVHPEDTQRIKKEFEQATQKGEVLNYVCRILLPNNEVKWVRVNAFPTPASQGSLVYNGFILDITNRKMAELEYLAAERKVKAMSQAVSDALIMIDSAGKVLFWNSAAEGLFGYSEDEALGMDFHSMAAPERYQEKIRLGLSEFASSGKGAAFGSPPR